jgi:hypothetical protein
VQVDFDPMSGEEAAKVINDFYATPPELVKKAAQMTQPAK